MDLLIAADTVSYADRAVAPTVGTPGWASAGNPGASPPVPPTEDAAYQFNAFQEELMNIIQFDGTPLNRNNNAQVLAAIQRMFRTRVVGGTLALYVSGTGSDSNSGLSPSAPLATIQKALTIAADNYDLTGTAIQISLAGGTYAGFILDGSLIPSSVTVVGNISSPSSVTISAPNGVSAYAANGAKLTLSGLTVTATGTSQDYYSAGIGINAYGAATVTIGASVIFGACQSGHMSCWTGSSISVKSSGAGVGGSYAITGSAPYHISCNPGGYVAIADSTITLVGTPSFSSAFCIANFGLIGAYGTTFSGGATGQRYIATNNGVINTQGAGATYLPGSVAGATGAGGQYT